MQERAEDEDATNTSLDLPPDVLSDAAAMLDSIYDESTAIHSQTTYSPYAEMELFNLTSQDSNDDPGIPVKV